MIRKAVPPKEAASALILLLLLVAALYIVEPKRGGGPLGLVLGLAAVHALLISPALVDTPGWGLGFLPWLLAGPAVAAASYGRGGADVLLRSFGLLALCAVAGSAGRALVGRRVGALYLPTMVLLLVAPFALAYLVAEFGGGDAAAWRPLSPWGAAVRIESGGPLSMPGVLALMAWPVVALVRPREAK
ncbi:MAG: hypothetical protein V3T86_17780 [Planctomycetota bacterium]